MFFFKNTTQESPVKNTKNTVKPARRKDFSFNVISISLLALFVTLGLLLRLITGTAPSLLDYSVLIGTPFASLLMMSLFPRWSVAVKLMILLCIIMAAFYVQESSYAILFAAFGALAAPSIQKMEEWERAIVLRFGKFSRVRGPGLFSIIPLVDRIAKTVDLRIRVTDFTAETTLTRDSVTVTVDALCFWLVWDAEKAICEVQDYEDAVVLSSKTALRSAISRNDLSTFLERGDVIEEQIRSEVDRKTTEWGITVQTIEITDIQIPEELQDSLSRLAQMEREKKGRILLAEAEIEIAKKFEEAACIYDKNGTALKLKSLSILNEGLKAGNSMMLVPDSITEELQSKDIFGLQALNETRRSAARKKEDDDVRS